MVLPRAERLVSLTPYPVPVAIEPVRIGRQHGEAPLADLPAIQVWWRRRNADIRIARIAPTALKLLRLDLRLLLWLAHDALCAGQFVRIPIRVCRAAGPQAQSMLARKGL